MNSPKHNLLQKKIKIHLLLLVFMYFVFVICTLVYGRGFSFEEWMEVVVYYGILVIILFCINLIKKKWIKWAFFVGLFFFPLSYLILTGTDLPDITSLDVLLASAPSNVPFVPEYINYPTQDPITVTVIFYVLYFILPLAYWYGLYILSKKIIAKMGKNKGKNAEK